MTARTSPAPGALAKYSLLGVTVLGTMSNNVITVPLNAIARDFQRPVSTAVLSVSAFILVLAVAMPITGWVGDRFGRRRVLIAALMLMFAAQLAAAAAPTLEALIAMRAVQGLACSAIPPIVMGTLASLYPEERLRMMGAWAAANGIGQAIGPPVGGLVNDLAGWRSIFVFMSVGSFLVLCGIVRSLPAVDGRSSRLHLTGALLLCSGVALLLSALTAMSLDAVPVWVNASIASLGALLVAGFLAVSRNNPRAMVPPHLIVESRFLRSSLAAFAQMFTLGTVLVVMPLYFTGTLDMSSSEAGLLFFVLPMAMAVMAPLVSRLSRATSPRWVLRSGLLVTIIGTVVTGLTSQDSGELLWLVLVLLGVLGVGMAMVQTPAASGATGSPAGSRGAALGLYNMLRFSGSTSGTAWVAFAYPRGDLLVVFVGCAVVGALGLAMSFFGPNAVVEPVSRRPATQ